MSDSRNQSTAWWCTTHYKPSPSEALHQHDLGKRWGATDEIRLGLMRFDTADGISTGSVELHYVPDGEDVAGSVTLDSEAASDLTGHLLLTAAANRRAGSSRPALLFQIAYESARAFVAAVRNRRAVSPCAASLHNWSKSVE